MRRYLIYLFFGAIVVTYSIIQTTSNYKAWKSERSHINSELVHNLKVLEEHPLNMNLKEYDNKYYTSLSLYNVPQAELIAYTKKRIEANNNEPFWSLDAFIKCFVYPLLAGVAGTWLVKKLGIL